MPKERRQSSERAYQDHDGGGGGGFMAVITTFMGCAIAIGLVFTFVNGNPATNEVYGGIRKDMKTRGIAPREAVHTNPLAEQYKETQRRSDHGTY